MAAYFNVSTSDTAWGTATITTGAEPSTNTTYVFTSTTATEFDWSKVSFTYIDEPTNVTEYNAFKSAVDAAVISVSYNVTVGSVA